MKLEAYVDVVRSLIDVMRSKGLSEAQALSKLIQVSRRQFLRQVLQGREEMTFKLLRTIFEPLGYAVEVVVYPRDDGRIAELIDELDRKMIEALKKDVDRIVSDAITATKTGHLFLTKLSNKHSVTQKRRRSNECKTGSTLLTMLRSN